MRTGDDDGAVREALRDLCSGRLADTVETYADSEAFLEYLSSWRRSVPSGRCPDAQRAGWARAAAARFKGEGKIRTSSNFEDVLFSSA